ncbi:hypothetical protein GRI42_09055 [Erythrobacter gaetbuli]|uniref:Uncharacterized protein n=1 Tax=Qipengyuania gaetbuli TaxID=266952 RepID=A0A844Y1N1_9SPHN|nr:hypothetical protein [Qipengyuania gaetbuli]MXO51449.1 hypothetical protein [Qipengyuania gaetbuli]
MAVGAFFLALALGLIPLGEDQPPTVMMWIIGIMGALTLLVGISHLRLRMRRRAAYSGGRERKGTVRLFSPLSEDSDTAVLLFANSHSEWLMSVDLGSLKSVKEKLSKGVQAKAYLGDDDRIYGLDIGSLKALPISPGVPYEGKLRSRMEWAKRKKAEWADKAVGQ